MAVAAGAAAALSLSPHTYTRLEWYPAEAPMKTKMRMKAVRRDPRLAGERSPMRAKLRVAKVMRPSCTPVPTMTANSMGAVCGGRNTSACTSFHPLSSLASSRAATSLYL